MTDERSRLNLRVSMKWPRLQSKTPLPAMVGAFYVVPSKLNPKFLLSVAKLTDPSGTDPYYTFRVQDGHSREARRGCRTGHGWAGSQGCGTPCFFTFLILPYSISPECNRVASLVKARCFDFFSTKFFDENQKERAWSLISYCSTGWGRI